MSLFASQLITLIATMEAVKEKKSFDMTNWHEEKSSDIVDCGFAACICGHQAVAEKSEFFNNRDRFGVEFIAKEISEDLDAACVDVFGNDFLAMSIYEGDEGDRWHYAQRSRLFTDVQLNEHPHLNRSNPTIKQAISFIKLCLKKVEAVK